MTDQPGGEPRYRLDSRIAAGGMGVVWRATDTVLGREVAVKVLKPENADDPTFRSRFQTEARHAAALHHPGVASVFDFGEWPPEDGSDTPRPYLVMELVPGQPLSALLRPGQPMPPKTAADLVAQACDAVAAAHAIDIVHRDIKPGNLIVTPSGQVKITDFGIARAADAAQLTMTGQVIGTPAYFAPEQAEGKPATKASDVYSLGVVLYECLAGRRPFIGDTPIGTALAHVREQPPPLPEEIPAHLREAVSIALAKDPARRFASAADFAAVLRGGPVPTGLGAGAAGAGLAGAGLAGAGAASAADDTAEDGTAVLAATTVGPPLDPPVDQAASTDRKRRAWLPWVAAAVAVLLVILLVNLLGGDDDPGDTPVDTPTPTKSAQPSRTTQEQSDSPTPRPSESTSPSATPSESPSSSPSPTMVEVVADDYLGSDAADARSRLEGLGLRVQEQKVENPGDATEGTVADLSPTGSVPEGSQILLSVYDKAAPAPPNSPGQGPAGQG